MVNEEMPDDWIIEYDTKITSNSRYGYLNGLVETINEARGANTFLTFYGYNMGWGITSSKLTTSYKHIKVTKTGTTYKLYVDDVLSGSATLTRTGTHLRIDNLAYSVPFTCWFKNLKIKPYSEV